MEKVPISIGEELSFLGKERLIRSQKPHGTWVSVVRNNASGGCIKNIFSYLLISDDYNQTSLSLFCPKQEEVVPPCEGRLYLAYQTELSYLDYFWHWRTGGERRLPYLDVRGI